MPETIVTIDHAWPARQFIPGGSANRYIDTKMRTAVMLARSFAPVRTGQLKASIRKTGTLNQGPLGAVCSMYSDVDHSWYVHEGTQGPIKANRKGGRMPVPKSPGGLPYRVTGPVKGAFAFPRRVKGQRAQPFMSRAADIAFKGTW